MGDRVEGLGHRVAGPRLETADIYRVSKLKLIRRGEEQALAAPWHGVPPPLPAYRERGHRRLAVTTYDSKCNSCIWGCAMAVEMIIDQWNPDRRRYRTEPSVTDLCPVPATSPVPPERFPVATA